MQPVVFIADLGDTVATAINGKDHLIGVAAVISGEHEVVNQSTQANLITTQICLAVFSGI